MALVDRVRRSARWPARVGQSHRIREWDDLAVHDVVCGTCQHSEHLGATGRIKRTFERLERAGISGGLDAGSQRCSVGGQSAFVEQTSVDEASSRGMLFLDAPTSMVEEDLRSPAAVGGEQEMGFTTVDACSGERGDMAITTVLAQRRAVLPEPLDRIVESTDVAVRSEHRSPDRRRTRDHGLEIVVDADGHLFDPR